MNQQVPGYAINPVTGDRIPVFFKDDTHFGELNSNGVPYVDSRLGIKISLNIMVFNNFFFNLIGYRNTEFGRWGSKVCC